MIKNKLAQLFISSALLLFIPEGIADAQQMTSAAMMGEPPRFRAMTFRGVSGQEGRTAIS